MSRAVPQLLPLFRSRALVELLTYLFLSSGDDAGTLSEIGRRLGFSPSTVQREVDRLERAGIVDTRRLGQARLVRLNSESIYSAELRSLVEKAFGPRQVLREILGSVRGIEDAYIFGSWAERYLGEPGPLPEDVDVLIVGEPNPRELYAMFAEASRRLGLEISPTLVGLQEWKNAGTGFLQTVQARPLIRILGDAIDPYPKATRAANARYVLPSPNGGWIVRKEGAHRASASAASQAEAIQRAREILRNSGGGELRISGRDGRIRSSDVVRGRELQAR